MGEILFFIFPDYTEIILISANHMYLVNKEYCFIIPMYYVVCNNQNSLERATKELKEVNIYIQILTLFSFSENMHCWTK